jgi:DNA-binding NarL/FixJ family response regulator
MEPLRVGIVEDQREIREGLAALVGGTPGYECTGAYRSVEEALRELPARVPQVLLLDVGLPGMSGIEGIPLLKARCRGLAIVMLTVYNDDERIIQAVCAGACGYLLKKTPPVRLLEGLREVAEGGAPMSPEIARRIVHLFREHRPPERSEHQLTPHETRLLQLLVEGHNYKTAAAEIGVTVHAISFHMRHIYEKLEVHSKSEAVAKALRQGLVR